MYGIYICICYARYISTGGKFVACKVIKFMIEWNEDQSEILNIKTSQSCMLIYTVGVFGWKWHSSCNRVLWMHNTALLLCCKNCLHCITLCTIITYSFSLISINLNQLLSDYNYTTTVYFLYRQNILLYMYKLQLQKISLMWWLIVMEPRYIWCHDKQHQK